MSVSDITEGYNSQILDEKEYNTNSENFEMNQDKLYDINNLELNHHGEILLSQGYSEHSSIANNNSKSICAMNNPNLHEHNQNINSQRINYDAVVHSENIEPINSNIGISFTQQHPHVEKRYDSEGNVLYVEKNPIGLEKQEPIYYEGVNESNVYDPRQNGYGTTYRAYVDQQLGNTKFFYDDINNIRTILHIKK